LIASWGCSGTRKYPYSRHCLIAGRLHTGSRVVDISFDGASNPPVYRVKNIQKEHIWENSIESTWARIRQEFEHGFEGMTSDPVSLDELLRARENLIAEVSGKMPKEHREFLIGFKLGKPDWTLLGVDGAAELPAVRWEQINLDKLRAADGEKLVGQLIAVLK
jgi:hypothetical protein